MVLSESSPIELSDYNSVWQVLIQFAIILVAVGIGNILRRKIKFIRNSLLPSSVIGGLLIFICKFIPVIKDYIDSSFMEVLTYHALALGFIALSLKTIKKQKNDNKLITMDTGITVVNTYCVQAIIALIITILLSVTLYKSTEKMYVAGLLLPMGFGQGTGQAYNFGTIFEGKGLENAITFGLAIAAIGFIVACICGVIYLNYLKKKGKLNVQMSRRESDKLDTNIYAEDESPNTDSMDKLTVQFALILSVYLVTFLVIFGLSKAAEQLGNFGNNTIKPLLWGFNFLFGSIFAILFKRIIALLKNKKIMKHTYVNNYFMNRISGFFFDIMIVAGIAAIDYDKLQGWVIPLILVCVFGVIGTFFYLKFICKRLYPDYEYEAFFSLFGMLTGTASTGMILLREIDPNYETPAAENLVLQQMPAILFGAPLLLLIPTAANSFTACLIILGIVIVMFIVYNLISLRRFIFKRKSKTEKLSENIENKSEE